MNNAVRREYLKRRRRGEGARAALLEARVTVAFRKRADDTVRLRVVPDDDVDLSYLEQPEFARVRADEYARANRDGCTGIVAEYLDAVSGDWIEVESCYGFIGDDWRESGYDTDCMRAALKARLRSIHSWRAMCAAAP